MNPNLPSSITKGDDYELLGSYQANGPSGTHGYFCESDVDGIISNISQLTTLGSHKIYCTTSSGAGKNALASKIVKITYKPYSATNLINNGSFETTSYDTSYTKSSTDYSVFGNRSLKAIGGTNAILGINNISTPINHIFYTSGYTYVKTLSSNGYAIQEIYASEQYNLPSWHYFSVTNGWQKNSTIGTPQNSTSMLKLGLWNVTSTDVAYFDGFLIIDLTATFGSGNEPDKDWCDKHINYFDGTSIIYK